MTTKKFSYQFLNLIKENLDKETRLSFNNIGINICKNESKTHFINKFELYFYYKKCKGGCLINEPSIYIPFIYKYCYVNISPKIYYESL